MADEFGAVWIPSPNHWTGRNGNIPRYVIIHGTAGGSSAEGIANWFANSASQVSSHYVIGQDGTIVQCVSEADSAWGNGIISGTPGVATPDSGNGIRDSWWSDALNPNLITISIEHVKASTDNSDQLTDAQKQASFTLISHICDRHDIPKRPADSTGGITGHYSIDAINRSHCPGNYPWSELWAFLGGEFMGGVPQGWSDDGTTLTAPNGHKVVKGFRDFVLQGWDRDNWPLTEEYGQTPLELSNPTQGGGTQQIFRWAMLGYTPAKGVFVEWIGQEVLALRQELTRHQQGAPDQIALSKRLADQQQVLQQVLPLSEQITALVKPLEAS